MTREKFNPIARRKARRFVLQAIYQWQVAGQSIPDILVQYSTDEYMPQADQAYFQELVEAITKNCEQLDVQLMPVLDRKITELDLVELAVLRMGTYELTQRLEIPYRVVINEAVELAKKFGGTDGHKYVNSILDKLAKEVRKTEIEKG